MADYCTVFFRPGACDLDAAVRSLRRYRLTVTRQGDELVAGRCGKPQFQITMAEGEFVREEAEDIGRGTPHAEAMRECACRFEVRIDDLDTALDEINTLMQVQGALQDASQGYLHLGWNGNLMEPWRE